MRKDDLEEIKSRHVYTVVDVAIDTLTLFAICLVAGFAFTLASALIFLIHIMP